MKLQDTPCGLEHRADFLAHLQQSLHISRRQARALLTSWMQDLATAKPRSR